MICGVLLAAGSASRFGSHKLLHQLADGIPIGVAAARNLKQGVEHSIAIVRPGDTGLTALLQTEGLDVVSSDHAERGISASLVAGIHAAADADGWIIALADMPWIKPQTISEIAMMLEHGVHLAAPCYEGQRGHPVGFSRRFLLYLLGLTGDKGASDILRNNQDMLECFHCNDAGILQDVDSPQDVLAQPRVRSIWSKSTRVIAA